MNVTLLLEFGNPWTYERLAGTKWEDVSKGKHPPTFAMWSAAQFDKPEIDEHGKIGVCNIIEDPGSRPYLKEYFVHGLYADGTTLNIGPMRREVASAYMQLHRLSANKKEWDRLKDTGFAEIQVIGGDGPVGKCDIIKLSDGYWIKDTKHFRIGPFASKNIARTWVFVNGKDWGIELVKKSPSDREEKVDHLTYPVFFFEYRMRNIPCADIVCAETEELAYKRFDFQWHVFDNTRPTQTNFSSLQQLERSLKFLRITDIKVTRLNSLNVDAYVEEAEKIGNPSTKPELIKYCRNSRFRYILGRDSNTGRSPVKIDY